MSHAHSCLRHVAAMLRLLSFLQNLNQNMWDPYWRTKSAYNLILKHLYCRDNLCKGNEYGSICNPMKLWRTLRVNFENFKNYLFTSRLSAKIQSVSVILQIQLSDSLYRQNKSTLSSNCFVLRWQREACSSVTRVSKLCQIPEVEF